MVSVFLAVSDGDKRITSLFKGLFQSATILPTRHVSKVPPNIKTKEITR